jgi:hypothetical protein
MTCYTSDFANVDWSPPDALDEELVRRAGGGAIATWGSSAQGLTSGHRDLHWEFFRAVFGNSITRLGMATNYAKAQLGDSFDLRDTFILLGDPALNLNMTIVPWVDELFLPLAMRNG